MSKLTLVLDSSQIAHFLECPTLWKYSDKEQLTTAIAEPKEALLKGTFGHRLMDIYYKSKASGLTQTQAMEKAYAFNPDNETCECGHPLHDHETDYPESPTAICKCLKCNCTEPQAKPFSLDKACRQEVRQRFVEYCYTYINNDIIPKSPEHVEVGFSEPILETADKLYVLEGRIDIIGSLQGLETVVDHKFQIRPHALYKKSIQFRNYAMITKKNMLIINYIRLTKGVSKDTLVREIASFTPVEHTVWKQRLIRVFDSIAEAIQSDTYEQRWDSCAGKYGYPCQFSPLCEQWDSKLIQIKKQQSYVKKEEWRPW